MTEQGREKLDEALNKLAELRQRWEHRLTLDNLALTKRYLKGELRIHFHLRSRLVVDSGRHPIEFCAIFERVLPVGDRDMDMSGHILQASLEVGGYTWQTLERTGRIENDAS